MKRIAVVALVITLMAAAKFGYENFYVDINARNESIANAESLPQELVTRAIEFPEAIKPEPSNTEIQNALSNLGIPTGNIDGNWGERTRQAFCIWRQLTAREENRNFPDFLDKYAIVNTKYLNVPETFVVGLNISKTCQSAIWVKNEGKKDFKVMIASTGKPGFETDNGRFKVGWKVDRWYESTIYPDGWMYRPLFFNRGQAVHGSEYDAYVWWYPASHGCVRMLGTDIDALWAAGFGIKSEVYVYGNWSPFHTDPV